MSALGQKQTCAVQTSMSAGEMIRGKTGPREHPLLKCELASRAFVVKTLRTLGLNVEGSIKAGPGRPGEPLGWTPDAQR